jgi:hypothetical protein
VPAKPAKPLLPAKPLPAPRVKAPAKGKGSR